MRRHGWLIVGSALAMGAGACSGSHESTQERAATVVLTRAPEPAQLDVPGLLFLTVDEVSRRLGPPKPPPAGFVDPMRLPSRHTHEAPDSTRFFHHQDLRIVVAYDERSRAVRELLLIGSNEDQLMARGNLRLDAPGYLLLPVFQRRRPTQLVGLRVLATALSR